MIAKSRMAKVEGKLTPQQVVLSWIADKRRRFGSFEEMGEWMIDQPDTEAPLNKTAKAAREAVRAAMKGQSTGAIEEAERQAIREAHFLVRLFINANEMLLRNTVPFRLEAEKCILKLRMRFVQLVICQDVREAILLLRLDPKGARALENLPERLAQRLKAYLPDGEEPWPQEEAIVDAPAEAPDEQGERSWLSVMTDIAGFRDEVIDYATRVYVTHGVMDALRRNYFAGQPIMFLGNSLYLEAVVKQAEALVSKYNGLVPRNPFLPRFGPDEDETPPEGLIDLEQVKAAVAANVRRNVAHDVRMAQAETLAGLGMNEEAFRLGREAYRKHFGTGAS